MATITITIKEGQQCTKVTVGSDTFVKVISAKPGGVAAPVKDDAGTTVTIARTDAGALVADMEFSLNNASTLKDASGNVYYKQV